jgi:hypothetical protein
MSFPLHLEAQATGWFLAAGAPRSGTTMLARLLNTHPRIGCLNELLLTDFIAQMRPFFAAQAARNRQAASLAAARAAPAAMAGMPSAAPPGPRLPGAPPAAPIAAPDSPPGRVVPLLPERQRRADGMAAARDAQLGNFGFGSGPGALEARRHGARVARALVEIALGKQGLTRLGSKVPNLDLLEAATALRDDLPNLRLIHIRRRPSDVINSSLGRRNKAAQQADVWHIGTVEDACREWIQDWNRAQLAAAALGDRLLCLRYEDILADGPSAAARLAAHLGVENAFDAAVCKPMPEELRGYAMTDGECAVVARCLGEVEAAWHAPLDTLLERFPRLALPLPAGGLDFRIGGNGHLFDGGGLSIPESWGRWTEGDVARLDLGTPPGQGDLLLTLDFQAWRARPRQPFQFILAAGAWRERVSLEHGIAGDTHRRAWRIPADALQDPRCLSIVFHILTPKGPEDEPRQERRRLGLGLVRLGLERLPH